jgi:hypothetical protein
MLTALLPCLSPSQTLAPHFVVAAASIQTKRRPQDEEEQIFKSNILTSSNQSLREYCPTLSTLHIELLCQMNFDRNVHTWYVPVTAWPMIWKLRLSSGH